MPHDLSAALEQLRAGRLDAGELLREARAVARSDACRSAFVRLFEPESPSEGLLGGLAVSIKDLFDVAGRTTSAGSLVLRDAPAAPADCPAVARLRSAGASLVGHTNMTEFAFSGLGLNPHYGTPANPVTAHIDGQIRIPGGSSSGAAVSVATGAAWAALGSDTGGSIRIPAALCGLVGFKNTQRLTPTDGTIPLATSLDTACAITRSVRDAVLLHEILAARRVQLDARPLAQRRFAVVTHFFQDSMDAHVTASFETALKRLRQCGAQIEEITLPPLQKALPSGIMAAAEAWAWHRSLMAEQLDAYDPRVAQRILAGRYVSAADYIDRLNARRSWMVAMKQSLLGFDAVLSPTVPVIAPLLQPLVDSDDAYFAANGLLLRNCAVVNALDGCALSLPCHAPGTHPVGLMLWSTALQDDTILDIALQVEKFFSGAH
ncbi:MAG: amidase [Paucibacter sp.]|nr:amidase [Roseateles sp.]